MRALVLAIGIGTACGNASAPPPAPAGSATSLIAPPASADDPVVAQVDGRPVWGSCVAAQVQRGAATRAAALDECIAFELLAGAAEQRGLAAHPDVVDATRTALVSRLLAAGFEDRYRTPSDLGERLTKVLDANEWRLHRPELRASTYARVVVPEKDAPPGADATARELAEAIAAALRDQPGLSGPHLVEAATRLAEERGLEVEHQDVKASVREALVTPYADALFAIPEVGRIAGPVRTRWGWDVILWTGGLPALERTRDELAAEVFPELRRGYFQVWVNQLVKEHGLTIEIDQDRLATLDEVGP